MRKAFIGRVLDVRNLISLAHYEFNISKASGNVSKSSAEELSLDKGFPLTGHALICPLMQ
jgi:hypothetical protein